MREDIPETWIGQRVRVYFRGSNAYGMTDDAWAVHEAEGTLQGVNDLGLLIDSDKLVTYISIHYIQVNPPKRH